MKPALIFHWPEMPALPPPGQPVLIRVVTAPARSPARQALRIVLHQVLAAWSKISPEQLPLRESASGLVWLGLLAGHSLDISLSYADGEGWIGLLRAGWIGVDILRMQSYSEAEAVARHYFDPAVLQTIQQAADPVLAFAAAWTALEARLKCLKQPLREVAAVAAPAATQCAVQSLVQPDRLMVTVATTPVRPVPPPP